ncbi:hypothetical protein B4096_3560 [Heyndrickxia coagulans]|uniref:Uncharacterized protein n=1 Tax=Heyndrickxia coagulans TaxID=1398 RepID=A0A133L1S4_HEYCO|nr:hypothetical protein HMPREF3213_00386 [Heyndrickxia coagulans]KYC59272.1 hypothetical protein B4100_3773 [Heyndrickxia coagulans]KYC89618.1 hypothetical protein B4096_3560 [Heyndrickxia coagulans]
MKGRGTPPFFIHLSGFPPHLNRHPLFPAAFFGFFIEWREKEGRAF